ncbi:MULTISPECIES: alpha/beta hydrolase [unclassified Oceanispirochaeta]|uniref:alpha/beta hydrolase n=1 Tax=unclassified Oceanispirochaeta TaxID=2635722 RepID=UPI000E091689|nr:MULTISPECIES: alpha/beta hydrolase [unclassified Oceanispirochaeta]MBF9016794.1 alpha/beta hydrolase [Oceanispirochaeta sp. M2]NPD72064.1 alpha/beta hydrolase [Oceanispirochaeta sp. M1]RDG32507.1 alpha/beta hydrolase [Oceanispirochaeta sp. M1]
MNDICRNMEKTIREAANSSSETPYIIPSFIESPKALPCVLICPGGGYGFTSPREAEPVARAYNDQGFHALILHYRTAPHKHPAPLLDVSNTLALLRQNAWELNVDPEKIIVCGFSAGGHLAASLGVHWNKEYLQNEICSSRGQNRPNALILSYPVISSGEDAHRGSFDNLLGENADAQLLEEMSLEKQVGNQTPPAFLWHTADDASVPVENSFLFAKALKKENIPFELHIYPSGPHGLSLATAETDESGDTSMTVPHVQGWLELSARWIKNLKSFN